MVNLYIGFGILLIVFLLCYLYYKHYNRLSRTIIGLVIIILRVRGSIIHLLYRRAADIEKMKEEQKAKMALMDETLNHTYSEVLGLHEKRGGLFKFIRKELKNTLELERKLEDEKAILELIRKENIRIREVIENAKALKESDKERQKIKKGLVFFPNAASPLMEEVTYFHDYLILFLVSISATTLFSLTAIYYTAYTNRYLNERQSVEYL